MLEVLLFEHKRQGLICTQMCVIVIVCLCDGMCKGECIYMVCMCVDECMCDKTLYMILSLCKEHETFKFCNLYIKWRVE